MRIRNWRQSPKTSEALDSGDGAAYNQNVGLPNSSFDLLLKDVAEQISNTDIGFEQVSNAQNPFSWTELLPKQTHHFASNKNKKYTPQFEQIVSKYGLELNEDWNKELMPHRGRHPNEYHEWILKQIRRIDRNSQGDAERFLTEFNKVIRHVKENPQMLRKKGWT